jgi:GTP:adenosylcobinamide-phosphate guanylyltransferase
LLVVDRSFAVVALAGGSLEPDFQRAGYDVPNKAYLPVGGELMLLRVLRALRGARAVSQIRCVTQTQAAKTTPHVAELCDAIVEPGYDLITSVMAGFAGLSESDRVLVVATDLPLLTPLAVDHFAQAVDEAPPMDLGYGFVDRRVNDQRFPNVRHTWVHLREGTFCGAGISMIRASAIRRVEAVLREFVAARKSPAKMASLFSPLLAIKILFGRLGVAELEQRASELTKLVCRGVLCPDAEVAVNVDRLDDLKAAESLLRTP